jgi:hypothetical protein
VAAVARMGGWAAVVRAAKRRELRQGGQKRSTRKTRAEALLQQALSLPGPAHTGRIVLHGWFAFLPLTPVGAAAVRVESRSDQSLASP